MIYKTKTSLDICTIAVASNEAFVPHLGVLLCSILENRKAEYFLEIIILDGGIVDRSKAQLEEFLGSYPNVNIQYYDTVSSFTDLKVHMHFSKDLFSRLVLDQALPNHDKVLSLDADMVILTDIYELFCVDIGNFSMGAVYDYTMRSFCESSFLHDIEGAGIMKARNYLCDYVGLKNQWVKYFNAGLMLINLRNIRISKKLSSALNMLREKTYWFLDQDVLNMCFSGDVYLLDPKWNVVSFASELLDRLPIENRAELAESMKRVGVIHFAGSDKKPWNNPNATFAETYWKYSRLTPWYELTICRAAQAVSSKSLPQLIKKRKGRRIGKFKRSLLKRYDRLSSFLFS